MDPRAQWIDYNNHKKLYMRGWGEKGRERKCVCMCLRMSVSECVCERERTNDGGLCKVETEDLDIDCNNV